MVNNIAQAVRDYIGKHKVVKEGTIYGEFHGPHGCFGGDSVRGAIDTLQREGTITALYPTGVGSDTPDVDQRYFVLTEFANKSSLE